MVSSPWFKSSLRIAANVAVVLGLMALAYSCWLRYLSTGAWNWLAFTAVNALMVVLYVARSDATAISRSPLVWALAFGGTCTSLLLRPSTTIGAPVLGSALQALGSFAIVLSLLSLRRSFGIVPAHRGLRTGGLYRYVRHPLYASELLTIAGMALASPSTLNLGCLGLAMILQLGRAVVEERFLDADPEYRQYRNQVRYRLIPRVI